MFDISHHNQIASWDAVPVTPTVHGVNGGKAVDWGWLGAMNTRCR